MGGGVIHQGGMSMLGGGGGEKLDGHKTKGHTGKDMSPSL